MPSLPPLLSDPFTPAGGTLDSPAQLHPAAGAPGQFARDAVTLIGAQGLITIAALGTSIVTSRALGVEGRGHFGLAVFFAAALVTFTDFGIGTAGARFVAGRQWPSPVILGSHLAAGLARILVVGLAGLVAVAFAGPWLFPGVPVEFLALGLLQIIPSTMAVFVLPLVLGAGRARTYSHLLVLSTSLGFAALCLAWWTIGLDVRTALIVQALAGFVTAAAIWRAAASAVGGAGRPQAGYLKAAYAFGIGVYASSVATFANGRLVLLLVNSFAGVAAVGLYTLAQTASERIYLVADAIGTILLPRIAEDPERNSARITPVVFRITMLAGAIAAASLALVAEWFVRILYTDEFTDAVPILRLLLVSVVLAGGWRVLSQDLNARGHSRLTAGITWIATAVNLGVAAVLLPRVGLQGAAWSVIAASTWSLGAGVVAFSGREGISALFSLTQVERAAATRLMRGLGYVAGLEPRFLWALLRAYVLDAAGFEALRALAPVRRRAVHLRARVMAPFALRRVRAGQVHVAARALRQPLLACGELGLSDASFKAIAARLRDEPSVSLGEFDHYGWLVAAHGPIRGLPSRSAGEARPRTRSRVRLIATRRGVAVEKTYLGQDARLRFLAEFRALEQLREADVRVPEIVEVDVSRLSLTMSFIPGMDLERYLEGHGAALTGAALRARLGTGATDQAIEDAYIDEGSRYVRAFAAHLIPEIVTQVKAVHRRGVRLSDIKYGNVIIHRDTGLPYLTDFDAASVCAAPRSSAFSIERDREIERMNRFFGTSLPTFDRIQQRLKTGDYPAADRTYSSFYIGRGLRLGPLWDRSTGFGRWYYILKRSLPIPVGGRVLSLGVNNASNELQLLRAGVAEVVAYEADPVFASQGQFLLEAVSCLDNVDYRLTYEIADMREAMRAAGPFDMAMALCSLYYLSEDDMRRVTVSLGAHVPRFTLQCNIREDIGRQELDQYRRASVAFAAETLRAAGFSRIIIDEPAGYSRPLVCGSRPALPAEGEPVGA